MTRTSTVLVVIAILALPGTGRAQSAWLWGEYGTQQNLFGNGLEKETQAWGAGMQLVIGGSSSQGKGFLVPVGLEIRSDKEFDALDLLGYGDLAFRIKNVSFGPGANFGYLIRPDVEDRFCPLVDVPSSSSCYAGDLAGFRDIGQFFGFGFSGFGKVGFGPQGRASVQMRYIYYHPDWIIFRSSAEALNASLGTTFDVPQDYPVFTKGRDVRFSFGYVFGNADKVPILVRAQVTDRRFDFGSENANFSGIFNQDGRQLTVGVGIGF